MASPRTTVRAQPRGRTTRSPWSKHGSWVVAPWGPFPGSSRTHVSWTSARSCRCKKNDTGFARYVTGISNGAGSLRDYVFLDTLIKQRNEQIWTTDEKESELFKTMKRRKTTCRVDATFIELTMPGVAELPSITFRVLVPVGRKDHISVELRKDVLVYIRAAILAEGQSDINPKRRAPEQDGVAKRCRWLSLPRQKHKVQQEPQRGFQGIRDKLAGGKRTQFSSVRTLLTRRLWRSVELKPSPGRTATLSRTRSTRPTPKATPPARRPWRSRRPRWPRQSRRGRRPRRRGRRPRRRKRWVPPHVLGRTLKPTWAQRQQLPPTSLNLDRC